MLSALVLINILLDRDRCSDPLKHEEKEIQKEMTQKSSTHFLCTNLKSRKIKK